jgi:formate dehydrogenase
MKPPFPAIKGLWGCPTVVNNVETIATVPHIINMGGDAYAGIGVGRSTGTKLISACGNIRKPGVYEIEMGISVEEFIYSDEYCGGMLPGHRFYGYLPGGASGGILPASLGDVPLDFDTLHAYGCFIGSAAVVVLSDKDRAADAARNLLAFFKEESCGQCTPCRVGTAKALDLLQQPKWDAPLLEELSQVMADASICGLGQAAPNPIRCVIKYFPEELR